MSIPQRQPNETQEQYLKRAKEELPKFLDAAAVPKELQEAIQNLVHQVGINTVNEIIKIHERKAKEGKDKMYDVMTKIGGPMVQIMEYQTNYFMTLLQVINAVIDYALATNTDALQGALKMYRDDGLSKGSGWRPENTKPPNP
jgi:hypothetical protein